MTLSMISNSAGGNHLGKILGSLRCYDADGSGNLKKAIRLLSRTTTLHT